MKKAVWVAALLSIGCILTGCQKFDPGKTGININSKKVITQVIKESFDTSVYSDTELTSQIEHEINEYNDKAGMKCIKSDKLKVQDGNAEITLIYASPEDFAAFNNEDFFVGPMYDAIKNNYTFEGSFITINNGSAGESVFGSKLMMDGNNYNTVVLSEPTLVQVPGTIKYVSENLKVTGTSTAVSETSDLAYILYE